MRTTPVVLHLDATKSKKKNVILNHANSNAFGLNGENGVVVLPTVPQVSPFILFLTTILNIN